MQQEVKRPATPLHSNLNRELFSQRMSLDSSEHNVYRASPLYIDGFPLHRIHRGIQSVADENATHQDQSRSKAMIAREDR